jgi:hypothetical protein
MTNFAISSKWILLFINCDLQAIFTNCLESFEGHQNNSHGATHAANGPNNMIYWNELVSQLARMCVGQPRNCGQIPSMGKRHFYSPMYPERLWNPLNGCWRLFPQRYRGWDVKLTTHLHLGPRLRILEIYLHPPVCLHSVQRDFTFFYLITLLITRTIHCQSVI